MSDAEDGVLEVVPGQVYDVSAFVRTDTVVPEPAAEMRYEDEDADKVTRVLVVVERADGSVREYEAREPQDFQCNDACDVTTMAFRTTGLSIGGGGGFRGLQAAVPTLSLSFSAHPRYNLHIRNSRKGTGREIQRGS